ncbi:conserved hypothetical protein [Acaryochloris marina MBIC11017]|uniref:Uncharacterized protein n=2 Tax=Acaryochloridaceae TaxID=1890429 RepID=B0CEZ6_ACAM1|nr:conserved hypothetical protein [Acaryochloris marina MBIC11017]KAI9135534.1 hypothetical protein ON05_009195 [Acaryochloris sp. CCMEE 5410]BDM78310.1 hypothetical protein AM10699_11800 [Acaryochloris marina MBIC10699]
MQMNLSLLQSSLNLLNHNLWIAQQFEDNLGSSFQSTWDNFIQSGQVWALIIGFIVGYVFRSITSY